MLLLRVCVFDFVGLHGWLTSDMPSTSRQYDGLGLPMFLILPDVVVSSVRQWHGQ